MLVFDEYKESNKDWIRWYTNDVAEYPLGHFSMWDSSFNMNVCVDIGANIGGFSMLAAHYFEKVFAFEPSRVNFISSLRNCPSNVEVYNLAVTGKLGDVQHLTCEICPATNNFHGHNASLVYGLGDEKETVLTIDLEKIYELAETDFIDYLKLDCEGSEWDILLHQDLSRIGIISAEIHGLPDEMADFKELRKKLLRHLRGEGFEYCLYSEHNFFARNTKFDMPCPKCEKEKMELIMDKLLWSVTEDGYLTVIEESQKEQGDA
jgi:FkbM family methyltransferase